MERFILRRTAGASIHMRRQKSKLGAKPAATGAARTRVRPGTQRAAELMELATDAAHSRDLREFLTHFSSRVRRMLSADWCGVVVIRGEEAEFQRSGSIGDWT